LPGDTAMLLHDLRSALRLLGPKGRRWAGLQMLFGMLVVGADYAVAAVLVLFLARIGVAEPGRMPSWLSFDVRAVPGFWFPVVLVSASLVRGLLVLSAGQWGHAALELVRLRLTLAHGYEMLLSGRQQAIPLSEVSLRMGEYVARAPDFVYNTCEAASYGLRAVGFATLLLFVGWRETAVGVLAFAVVGVVTIYLNRSLAQLSYDIPRRRAVMDRLMVRVTRNWLFVRASNLCRREYGAFTEGALGYFGAGVRLLLQRNLFSVLPPFLGTVALLATIYVGVAVFETAPLVLAGFLYLFLRFAQTVSRAAERVGAAAQVRAQFEGAAAILEAVPDEDLTEAVGVESRAGFVSVAGSATPVTRAPMGRPRSGCTR
jgi:ABC-type multidrug transport system fused ATPase/permease subunit